MGHRTPGSTSRRRRERHPRRRGARRRLKPDRSPCGRPLERSESAGSTDHLRMDRERSSGVHRFGGVSVPPGHRPVAGPRIFRAVHPRIGRRAGGSGPGGEPRGLGGFDISMVRDSPGLLFRGLLALGCLVGITLGGSTILRGILPGSLLSVPASVALGTRLVALGCLALLALLTLWAGMHPRSLFPVAQFRFGDGDSRSNRSDRRRNLVLRWSGVVAAVGATGSMLAGILR